MAIQKRPVKEPRPPLPHFDEKAALQNLLVRCMHNATKQFAGLYLPKQLPETSDQRTIKVRQALQTLSFGCQTTNVHGLMAALVGEQVAPAKEAYASLRDLSDSHREPVQGAVLVLTKDTGTKMAGESCFIWSSRGSGFRFGLNKGDSDILFANLRPATVEEIVDFIRLDRDYIKRNITNYLGEARAIADDV